MSATSASAREQARHPDGRFGEQHHGDPGQVGLDPNASFNAAARAGADGQILRQRYPDLDERTAALVEALNDHLTTDADTYWQDVSASGIVDDEATEALDTGAASDRFVTIDGTVISFDHHRRRWQEQASAADRWEARLVDINQQHPRDDDWTDTADQDSVGVFRNGVLVDHIPVESAEGQDPYDRALADAAYPGIDWGPDAF